MYVTLGILALVFVLIAVRQVGKVRLRIWQIMLSGAVVVLATGRISPSEAGRAINWSVLVFLFGVFVLGQALEDSGYLEDLSYRFFRRAHSTDALLLMILFGSAGGSLLLMNDTLAVIGTPVVLLLARRHAVPVKMLLLALAFGVTIGSVTSPIGNPQNLLIALEGRLGNSFVIFFRRLFPPTAVSLFAAYFILKLAFRDHFQGNGLNHVHDPIRDRRLAQIARAALLLLIALVLAKVAIVLSGLDVNLPLVVIAVVPATVVLLASRRRWEILRRIDWSTLIFFAALFILMEAVWLTGFFQSLIDGGRLDLQSPSIVILVSVGMSQFISNVPLVALLLPMLAHAGATTRDLMALAAGATVAGNFSILGAASNVIIIQNAEKRGSESLSFLEFSRLGIPLTVLNVLFYWLYLRFI